MRALILVDIQNDFVPGGSLAVDGGHEVVPVANRLQAEFELVVATQDWHPRDHGSFAANHEGKQPGDEIDLNGLRQTLWPVHCVQETRGAEFHPDLETGRFARVFRKGMDPGIDSYSGFFDNGRVKATGLHDYLKKRGVDEVHVAGLATDVCVKFTALDAVELGFRTVLHAEGCRGVDLEAGDSERAIAVMREADVEVVE